MLTMISSVGALGPVAGAGRLQLSLVNKSSCLIVTTKKMMSANTTSIIGVMSSCGFSWGLTAISLSDHFLIFFRRLRLFVLSSPIAWNEIFQMPASVQAFMT